MKLKFHWLVLRLKVNGRSLTIKIPIPRVGVIWEEVVGLLLFSSFVALLGLGAYIWAAVVHMVAWVLFAVFFRKLIDEMEADPEGDGLRGILFFMSEHDQALFKIALVMLMSVLWPLTFLYYIFGIKI